MSVAAAQLLGTMSEPSKEVREMSLGDAEYPVKISVEEAWHHLLRKSAGPDLSSGLEADRRLLEAFGETASEPMRVKLVEDDADLAQEWVQANLDELPTGGDPLWDALSAVPPEWSAITTVMMRNIPNKYTQRMLLMEVHSCGFSGTFDFLYLPIDAETAANRGYAFLNFLDPGSAWMFRCMFEGRKMSRFNSKKVISVVPATLQGFDANYAHYNRARVSRGDPSARPLFLREPAPSGLRGSLSMKLTDPWSSELFESAAHQPAGVGEESPPGQSEVGRSEMMGYVANFCSQCGGRIQPMFQFCPSCGLALDFGA